MKRIEVVAAIIIKDGKIFATQRGYGEWKDYWEFPGGKMEPGETPEEALRREIREELATEIEVGELLTTVEYDYPDLPLANPSSLGNGLKQASSAPLVRQGFHLTMHCFMCKIIRGDLELLEHEAAKWLIRDELHSVNWLPADEEVIELLKGKAVK